VKKGIMLSLDAVFALIIIFSSIYLFFIYYNSFDHISKSRNVIDQSLNTLSSIKISDICVHDHKSPNCECAFEVITEDYCNFYNPLITNPSMSLLDYLGELYSRNDYLKLNELLNQTLIQSGIVSTGEYELIIYIDDFSQDIPRETYAFYSE
jgi:hypothetical protein